MKRKTKKRLASLIVIILLIGVGGFIYINYISKEMASKGQLVNKENNIITFNCSSNYKYIDIIVEDNKGCNYTIIAPNGNKTSNKDLEVKNKYEGKGTKGEWKIVFDIEGEENIDFAYLAKNRK